MKQAVASLMLLALALSLGRVGFGGGSAVPGAPGGESDLAVPSQEVANPAFPHQFYFTRAMYSGYIKRGLVDGVLQSGPSWAADYPKSDVQLAFILDRLLNMDVSGESNALRLDDPNLNRFPFIYAVEVGLMELTAVEVQKLRAYLLSGGFLMVDDFWGSREWALFSYQMRRVFPDRRIVDIPITHPLFHMVYDIWEVEQVPNLDNIRRGRTWEADGFVPEVRGIFDDRGRLMVAVNWNTDLGDAWEWAESPDYPLRYSRFASEIAVNTIIYAMSH